jgi:predicted ester cyclase
VDDQAKKDQIARIFDVFNSGDLDALDEIFHPDYVDHSPMGEIHGLPAFKEFVRGWLDAFPDGRFEISNVIVEGDLAAWQARFTGTNQGPLMGMPPTGKSVDVLGLHMGRIDSEGRPVEHWTGNDQLLMMQQLGLVPQMTGA